MSTCTKEYLKTHYINEGSFYVDFISALPLDFFALIPIFPGVNTLPLFRLNKVVRLSHLYEYFTWMETFFINYRGYLSTPARRFTRLYYVLILACHYLACGFLLVAKWEIHNDSLRNLEFSFENIDIITSNSNYKPEANNDLFVQKFKKINQTNTNFSIALDSLKTKEFFERVFKNKPSLHPTSRIFLELSILNLSFKYSPYFLKCNFRSGLLELV